MTSLVLSADSKSIEDRVIGTLDKLDLWFTENELLMTVGKTQIVEFNYSVKRTDYNKRKGTATLESSERVFVLGVHLDHILNWKDHIHVLCGHMARYAYVLKVLASTYPRNATGPNNFNLVRTKYAPHLNPIERLAQESS
ncbi:hypothetical protein HHI36_007098 [Cryptolaemus montrouzieri]|uniref:Uncharacterized protein n=1 Tax=Cryptolaemus montrouzieri TaxID=559131 RepID=A0ABD2MNH3_9CUCU